MLKATKTPVAMKKGESAPVKRRNGARRIKECNMIRITFDPTGTFASGGTRNNPCSTFSLHDFIFGMVPDEELGTIVWPDGMRFKKGRCEFEIRGGKVVNQRGGLVDLRKWNHANVTLGARKCRGSQSNLG